MNCKYSAYPGDEPYIFVSYCHKDREKVFPYIEKLNEEGYRVWYDDGIIAGSEWPEAIAQKLEGASVFVAFISEASVNSHNCRKEINHAVKKEKKLAIVFLEKVDLTPGMAMQISDIQSIRMYECTDKDTAYAKLKSTDLLYECRGQPKESKEMYNERFSEPDEAEKYDEQNDGSDDTTVIKKQDIELYFEYNNPHDHFMNYDATVNDSRDKTIHNDEIKAVLTKTSTGEEFAIEKEIFIIGRSKDRSDYCIDNSKVSREHAKLVKTNNKLYVQDLESTNHTYINDEEIETHKQIELYDGDLLRFSNEEFKIKIEKKCCEEEYDGCYGVLRFVFKGGKGIVEKKDAKFSVGRVGEKADVVITNNKDVGRQHAFFYINHEKGEVLLQDAESKNGTYINDVKLEPNIITVLRDGDKIRFADVTLRFHYKNNDDMTI